MSNRERPMQDAARQLLNRQHDKTGAPITCKDPAVYAAVAKLLRDPMTANEKNNPGRRE